MCSRRPVRNPSRIFAVAALLLMLFPGTAEAQQNNLPASYASLPFTGNEMLRFAVRWKFIRLGTVIVRQEVKTVDGVQRTLLRTSAKSASGLPFIDIRMKNQALLDPADPRCIAFMMQTDHEPAEVTRYSCDAASGTLSMELRAGGKLVDRQTRKEARRVYDALGMFMLIRGMSGSGERMNIPLLFDFDVAESRTHSSPAVEDVEVPAIDREIPAHQTSIRSSWVHKSVGGLSGNMEVWCSADDAAIPLRVEVDIALGSIVLELEEVQRSGWSKNQCAELTKRNASNKGGSE